MKNIKFYKGMFMVAAVYDLFLGFLFFLFYKSIYSLFSIELPNNPAYLQLSAGFVFVQGIFYLFVYRNLKRNIDIVKVGIAYKIVYSGLTFYYWALGELPHQIFALFGFLDLIFIGLFALYLKNYKTVIMEIP